MSKEDSITVPIYIPIVLQKRLDAMAKKKMSNFSQVVREATSIGLDVMERQTK